jgi:acetyl-CoA carboxylase alpha subunit
MSAPEGYRKALGLMKQRKNWTSRHLPGGHLRRFLRHEAEQRGQCKAIAEKLAAMLGLETRSSP